MNKIDLQQLYINLENDKGNMMSRISESYSILDNIFDQNNKEILVDQSTNK